MSDAIQHANEQEPQQNSDDTELQSEDLEDVAGGAGDIVINGNCKCAEP